MAEQIGVVVETVPNGPTKVLTARKRARGNCHPGLDCDQLETHVTNPIDAGVGDVVKISLPPSNLFKGAAILYLLPITALIAGAIAGLWLGSAGGWGNVGSVAGGLAGLALGFLGVRRLGGSRRMGQAASPVITAVVRPSGEPPRPDPASCCG